MAKDANGIEIPTFEQASAELNSRADLLAPKIVTAPDGVQLPVDNTQDLSHAIMSDEYSINPNETFYAKKYDGTVRAFPGKHIKEVLQSGDYTLESKEETLQREDNAKYGDKEIQAGALGAARGLTFGLSDQFLKSGEFYKGDELRGIENANTASSVGGEVVGALAPALFSGGTSLAAKGISKLGAGVAASEALGASAAKGIASRIAEKQAVRAAALEAGEKLAVSEAATVVDVAAEATQAAKAGATAVSDVVADKSVGLFSKSLEKAGYATSQAKSIAEKMLYGGLEHMAPDAANLAVQGALQGAGRLVTEDAFGTADFNAENLIAYAGLGSLVGGTFGAAIGAGKALVPKVSSVLKPLTDGVVEFGEKVMDPEKAALRLGEFSPSQLSKIEARQPGFSKDWAEASKNVFEKNPKIKDSAMFHEAVIKEMEDKGVKISEILSEADALAAKERPGLLQSVDSLQRKLMRAKDNWIAEVSAGSTPKELEAIHAYADHYITGLGSRIGVDSPVTAKLMQAEKATLANRAFASAVPTSEELSIKALQKKFSAVMGAEQEQIVRGAAEFRQGVGNMVEDYAKLKKGYQTLANGSKNSDKIIKKELIDPAHWDDLAVKDIAVGAVLGGKAAIAVKLAKTAFDSTAMQKRIIMGTFDSSIRSAKIATQKGLAALSNGTAALAKAAEPSVVRSLVSSQLAVKTVDGKKIKPKNEQEAYNNIIENANKAINDPESVLQHSNRQTAAMFDHAPNTAAAVDAKYLQMMQFIASKAKKSSKNTGIFDVNKAIKPSGFETAKLARYIDAISNPTSMLSKAAQGKLSREHVEVVSSLFPQIHNKLKEATLQYISQNKAEMKYTQKLQLGLLLGLQAHESMQPQNIQALQAQFGPEAPQNEGANYNQGAVGDMGKSDALESDLGASVGE